LNGPENGSLSNHAAKRSKLSFNDTEGRGHKLNFELLSLILTCLLVFKTFSKGPLTCDQIAWQDDSVPDGIQDDPPLNDIARSRQGGTQVILDKWVSIFLDHFCYDILLRTVNRCSNHQIT